MVPRTSLNKEASLDGVRSECPSIRGSGLGGSLKTLLLYGSLILFSLGIFVVIQVVGKGIYGPNIVQAVDSSSFTAVKPKTDLLPPLLFALFCIVALGRTLGFLGKHFGQPAVIGEVIAGILLGPSFLGWLSPQGMQAVLPSAVAPQLATVAQIGVILYMFLVGLELNVDRLKGHSHSTVMISHASILVPFLLGALISLWIYQSYAPENVSFTVFALFMGIAMSITAFPVLARILTDRKMQNSELGMIALSCAAVDDATAWCLLAVLVGIAKSNFEAAALTIALTLAYVIVAFYWVRPLLSKHLMTSTQEEIPSGVVTLVFLALLASALLTEWIGIHAIFGAFLLGLIIPSESTVARTFRNNLEDLVTILFLPAFFAFTGMRTEINLLGSTEDWITCVVVIALATLGKFGGTFLACKLFKFPWRTAASLGILMNTRGLMELIVLNIGLDIGVISPRLFAIMVLMAVATTLMTSPILRWTNPKAIDSQSV